MVEGESLKILIADDNDSDRMILQTIIRRQGHQVVTAVDGLEAVQLYESESPQIVLLDALMPRMDGFEAARIIKELAGEELVPIIFLTSLTDAESLVKCLDAGGDDFLSKPYNRVILQAKINALNRMRVMHATLQEQRDQIADNNKHLLQEQEVAKTVFDNVAHMGCLHAKNIKHLLSPLSVFNGDVLLACQKPSGSMHVLLGDFTGHGLPAAIGAMPLAEIFYGMSNKGFAMTDVLREINQKLKQILPIGFFCCACMIEIDFLSDELQVWMGGLPNSLLVRNNGEVEVVKSNHLPLGVLPNDRFAVETYKFELSYGDRFFMWSDGIIESRNTNGDMFGEERLHEIVYSNTQREQLFTEIHFGVSAFIGEGTRDDDLTMVEVGMMPREELGLDEAHLNATGLVGAKNWAFSYELRSETLREFNPLPLMLHLTMEVPGLRLHSGSIYTVMAELFSNALEHGILGLDSKLKSTPEGFARYYSERARKLEGLTDDWIRFQIDHKPDGPGGIITIKVEDSGPGFDYGKYADYKLDQNKKFSGRGIPLLMTLCKSVDFNEAGNAVEVEYHWQPEAKAG
ncbi:MAG: fused response regulator/phosphatase [Pseudomonadales bacterium]|uniref:Response regulator signal transduction protein phosphatase 2C/histidine kinase n=1 Tax=Oleiphilus messinensis TaxID=141451 RepID=A0A1Y0IAM7_9GAMM|nr:fused response regulator/phosphatase [Oleiphilus messinensis]ARU57577.1 response regulator signal transduction protein phosphatase 2C/histidine kinase [Oleiphilus messinensis]MCG8613488.1 fused response regulator/phosphatase [Pseudomonadales bacterium]